MSREDIRLSLPSKGRLAQETLDFLESCALKVYRPNPRQYAATIPNLPGLTVMFQRPGDIVSSVHQGSVDFGITGLDVLLEKRGENGQAQDRAIVTLHDALGFAPCTLSLAVPETWEAVTDLASLAAKCRELAASDRSLRVATKYPYQTRRFLERHSIVPYTLIDAEGTLEIAPAIGYADLIADLVSTGTTLRDNHLRVLDDGVILSSQACLIANRDRLRSRPHVLAAARELLEYLEAYLRAQSCYLLFANIRGDSPQAIAGRMSVQPQLSGLQGPTISPVFPPQDPGDDGRWYAVNLVVRKDNLTQAIAELRAIGGSGVIASSVTYVFEEEPERCRLMMAALEEEEEETRPVPEASSL